MGVSRGDTGYQTRASPPRPRPFSPAGEKGVTL